MNNPGVNVRFEIPTNPPVNWDEQAQQWRDLNATEELIDGQMRSGHPGFYPLTIKAAYVIGVIHDLCSTVSHLLQDERRQQFYIPAYGIFASGVDLLGRCLQGNNSHNPGVDRNPDILAGFKWLRNPVYPAYVDVQRGDILIETSQAQYTIDMLMAIRHFAAHGQATTNAQIYEFRDIDYEILRRMPPLLANGLGNYWSALTAPQIPVEVSEHLCNQLARANIVGFRHWPIYKSWRLFQREGVDSIFQRFDWV